MNPIRNSLAFRFATLTATVLFAASTAVAMQATTPTTPIPPERAAKLADMRKQVAELRRQAEAFQDPAGREASNTAFELEAEMLRQPESENALELVQLDARTLVMAYAGDGASRSVIPNLVSSLNTALRVRNSKVTVGFDEQLGTLFLQGMRWQVDEAKSLARDLSAALAQRIEEIRLAESERVAEERQRADRDQQERRLAEQDELRAKTVTISWNGGKLADLIAAVKKQTPCNVVLGDATLGDVLVPPLSVQLMSPEVFFQMLPTLQRESGVEFSVFVVNQASIDPTATTPMRADGSLSAITISRVATSESAISREVFDVRDWSKEDDASRLVESIAFTMDAAGFADKVKIRLHAPSKLLFVQGPREAVVLVSRTIDATRTK